MKFLKLRFTFLVLFVVMLIDGHLQIFLTNLFRMIFTYSVIFTYFNFVRFYRFLENINFVILLLIGLLYDAYYFHIIGLSTLLLPLSGIVVSKYNSVLMTNRVSRFLSVAILVFFL